MQHLDVIRGATLRQLRTRKWLEETIRASGLARPGATVGAGIWQAPQQLAPYLIYCSRLKIDSYAEIGVFEGGTFALTVEYLNRFHPLRLAIAIDTEIRSGVSEYASARNGVVTIQARSDTPQVRDTLTALRPDLILIDADHTGPAVRHDWELARRCARFVAFHDICEHTTPDVRVVWDEIGGQKRAWEEQTGWPPVYGIGLTKIQERGAASAEVQVG